MFLIIKGSLAEAIEAALSHGIALIGDTESVAGSIYCNCDESHNGAAVRWFCESQMCGAKGYPAGTLLFYR